MIVFKQKRVKKWNTKLAYFFTAGLLLQPRENLVPIYLRITSNGGRIEQATNRTVELSKWSSTAGRMKGTRSEARMVNNYLDTAKNKVYALEREMVLEGGEITYQSFKEK